MTKDNKRAIRSHWQEREWLLSLGKGNIVEGVRNLIQLTQQGPSGGNGIVRPKSRESKQLSR